VIFAAKDNNPVIKLVIQTLKPGGFGSLISNGSKLSLMGHQKRLKFVPVAYVQEKCRERFKAEVSPQKRPFDGSFLFVYRILY
jgi:hypothetical protein